ncbi:MAG: hypothetical protein ACR2QK_22780 [Acidimicrobiales bacterium]
MDGKKKWVAVIVAGTILAILLGANGPLGGFWGVETGETDPEGGILAGLILASIVESIAFGVGLAWIAFGRGLVKHVSRPLAMATYVAVAWSLVSWAPHTAFHQSLAAENWGGLLAVEWGFHITLVIGAFVVATFVWRILAEAGSPRSATAAGAAA